jgi:hypothetical protein
MGVLIFVVVGYRTAGQVFLWPGHAQVVKVERPTGRTTFATWAWSGSIGRPGGAGAARARHGLVVDRGELPTLG